MTVEETVVLLRSELDAIWLKMPSEIEVLSRGAHPRGVGSRGQYLTPIMFAEGAARSLADETLWSIMTISDEPGVDLSTLKIVIKQMVGRKAGFFELFGLDHVAHTVNIYVETAVATTNVADLRRLTEAMVAYVNRVHVWIDAAFPWGVCSGYMRPPMMRTTLADLDA